MADPARWFQEIMRGRGVFKDIRRELSGDIGRMG
jgi:hypothetical protein